MVDGVYDSDPKTNAMLSDLSLFTDALNMSCGDGFDSDLTKMDNKVPLIVFDLSDPENIIRVLRVKSRNFIILSSDLLKY